MNLTTTLADGDQLDAACWLVGKNLIWIFLVLFAAGCMGGLASYFLACRKLKPTTNLADSPIVQEQEGPGWFGHIVIGLVASFITPLLLTMISSNVLTDCATKPHLYFVLAAMALLASVFGRRFLPSMYENMMKQLQEVKDGVNEAKAEVKQTKAEVKEAKAELNEKLEIIEAPTDGPSETVSAPHAAGEATDQYALQSVNYRILWNMANSRFESRSFDGLRKNTKLAPSDIHRALGILMNDGFVTETKTREGEPRWMLTPAGRQKLEEIHKKHKLGIPS